MIYQKAYRILRHMVHFDPKRMEFTPYGFSCERWEPELMHRPDKHNEIEINYFEEGRLTYLFWGERFTVEGGKPAIFWAATPHQIVEYEDLKSYLVITLPLPWVLNWNLPDPFITQVLKGRLIQEEQEPNGYPDTQIFNQWHKDINHNQKHCHEYVLLEIKARLLRLAANLIISSKDSTPPANTRSKPVGTQSISKIETMAKYIAQNYTKQICAADIAAKVNLHPDYAADLFRKTFGVTLNNVVIQYRVQHAQRMLVTTNSKILEIAYSSGFNSLSRFNASFKKLCGCTPREYRIAHQLPNL